MSLYHKISLNLAHGCGAACSVRQLANRCTLGHQGGMPSTSCRCDIVLCVLQVSRSVDAEPLIIDVVVLSVSQHANSLLQRIVSGWTVLAAVSLPSSSFAGNTLEASTRAQQACLYGQHPQEGTSLPRGSVNGPRCAANSSNQQFSHWPQCACACPSCHGRGGMTIGGMIDGHRISHAIGCAAASFVAACNHTRCHSRLPLKW
jgi:hypothetical protein